MSFRLINSQNIKSKTIVVRLGLDSPVQEKRLIVSSRIREHAKTVKELSEKGARLVLLAHQGRKGKQDFISLEQHAKVFSKLSGREIIFCSWKEDFQKAINGLNDSEVLLMDNTRFQEDEAINKTPEEHSKSAWVKKIASESDFFVQNALSACHRSHASVVGFAPLLPSFVGPQLERELFALEKIAESKSGLFILGGAKISDSIELMEFILKNKKAGEIAVAGLLGELFLKTKGINLGEKEKFFEEKGLNGLLPKAKELLQTFSQNISLPIDVAVNDSGRKEISVEELPSSLPIMDVGAKTIESIKQKIANAESIVFNGPLGVYEQEGFEIATKEILSALRGKDKCIIGGGDTETALHTLGFSPEQFFHVSLAGKALLEYLAGKELPGLKVLEK